MLSTTHFRISCLAVSSPVTTCKSVKLSLRRGVLRKIFGGISGKLEETANYGAS
jgi:hypothetical protein